MNSSSRLRDGRTAEPLHGVFIKLVFGVLAGEIIGDVFGDALSETLVFEETEEDAIE